MTEFVVSMENRPGRLAALTEALAAFGVNIEALTAYGRNGEGTVRLIVDDAPTTRRVLEEAALHNEERTVLTARLPHRPGELARLTRSIADAGINIEALYVLKSNADGIELAISVDQPETALPHLEVTGGVLVRGTG
ncbi:MAG: ACT domain-containing protein [Actinobacteria bacterium]|nr:ACT domain-containing protein [Actinomycetota bacterium]MCI0544729.1 ACT domain-containing protein [Actinomycetota bacterium]MCI0677425.1 ACT domain-containing protein [Actinomycetota bacterium]